MRERLPAGETPLVERRVGRDRTVSTVVVEAVAAASGVDLEELPPLYDAIDPDLLDGAFDRAGTELLVFLYADYVVRLDGDRVVSLYERE